MMASKVNQSGVIPKQIQGGVNFYDMQHIKHREQEQSLKAYIHSDSPIETKPVSEPEIVELAPPEQRSEEVIRIVQPKPKRRQPVVVDAP